mmetsp:Transcript_7878/g.26807  ORF Transcript_7878/g.26807 Transcript_7878/m.26807 type:complete len:225 (+) Transcript_7878:242-916(+)
MWLRTRWLAASAAMSESSPARTAAATMVPRRRALVPGASGARAAPRHPIISRHAPCAGSEVPPPTVPTSMLGMVTLTWRLSPSSATSMRVMQLELSTFCAGSWPQARYTAVTMFAACALKPPTLPAMALPTRFLFVLVYTMAETVVLSVERTTEAGMTASATTVLPRPSIQLIAAGFLSVHMLPLMATSSTSGKSSWRASMALTQPLDTMFMPMASPDWHVKRR